MYIDSDRELPLSETRRWVAGFIVNEGDLLYDTDFRGPGEKSFDPIVTITDPDDLTLESALEDN